MVKEIKGNLLDTHCKLIAHGVNCQGVMGSGVAKALYEKYPEVKENYLSFCKLFKKPNAMLGSVHLVHIPRAYDQIVVANCFTQQNYGYDGQIYLNYDALQECISELYLYAINNDIKEIAIPKIGCGLAGGDWELVKKILLTEDLTINVYSLE